jgi:hypothetical protein
MPPRQEKALNLNGVTAPDVQTEGKETDTIPLGKGTIMLEATTVPPTVPVVCPVNGCTGPFYDENSHSDKNPEYNLHYAAGYDGELLIDVHPVMDSTTWPRWALYLEVLAQRDEHTPTQAIAIAQLIIEQAAHVQALNDALEAQAWFDAHPDALGETVASVMMACSPAVVQLIVTQIASAPVLDYSGHTVANAAGYVIDTESIVMQSICNGDEARNIQRARFFVNVGA